MASLNLTLIWCNLNPNPVWKLCLKLEMVIMQIHITALCHPLVIVWFLWTFAYGDMWDAVFSLHQKLVNFFLTMWYPALKTTFFCHLFLTITLTESSPYVREGTYGGDSWIPYFFFFFKGHDLLYFPFNSQ